MFDPFIDSTCDAALVPYVSTDSLILIHIFIQKMMEWKEKNYNKKFLLCDLSKCITIFN